jgi:hypothetical protein
MPRYANWRTERTHPCSYPDKQCFGAYNNDHYFPLQPSWPTGQADPNPFDFLAVRAPAGQALNAFPAAVIGTVQAELIG